MHKLDATMWKNLTKVLPLTFHKSSILPIWNFPNYYNRIDQSIIIKLSFIIIKLSFNYVIYKGSFLTRIKPFIVRIILIIVESVFGPSHFLLILQYPLKQVSLRL